MLRTIRALVVLLLFVSCGTSRQAPDLILSGGRVFTSDAAKPWAEAVAIKGDRISAVGTDAQVRKLAGRTTRTIALDGKVVVPGFNDAHVHVPWGLDVDRVQIRENATLDEMLQRVEETARRTPQGNWLQAEVPVSLVDDPRLTRDTLDTVTRNHPVILTIFGGHAAVVNTAALRAFQIREDEPDTQAGTYGRSAGRLNGWLYEHALWSPVGRVQYRDSSAAAATQAFAKEAVRFGITSVQDIPTTDAGKTMRAIAQSGVPLRFRLIELQMGRVNEAPRGAVKYIIDGSPIERGAAFVSAYADRPANRGRLNYSDADIRRIIQIAAQSGQPHLLHVVGDRATEVVVNALNATAADWPRNRFRIEHGDALTAAQMDSAKRLGLIVVQNPSHFTLAPLVESRLGAQRRRSFMPFRSLIDRGVHVAIGSDGPLNPFLNIMFATTHPTNPAEAITREQAVIAYTRGSAIAEFAEREKGTIAPGMLADLAVLSQDIFKVPPQDLPKTESVMTIIGGKIVWQKP